LPDFITDFIDELSFYITNWEFSRILDLLIIAVILFLLLRLVRGTQAFVLLRGVLFLIVLFGLLTLIQDLDVLSWLVEKSLPIIGFAILVIFAPEIRHALERLGRASPNLPGEQESKLVGDSIDSLINATARLSSRKHGALIVLQRRDDLFEYINTGVVIDAALTTELLLQVFYPNTPLHDGAVIISDSRIVAASCVLPLSSSGVLTKSPERQMGLRHRAALGISEVSDAVAVVISEETGYISVVNGGRMIQRLDAVRLENILRAIYQPARTRRRFPALSRLFERQKTEDQENE
jgi:diadenylate cyclase